MNKLLSIVGPTATGKTNLALQLIEPLLKNFSRVDVISADSRQVYAGMEIGTGVDLPTDLANERVLLHGTSFLKPTEEWSVAHFQDFARPIIEASWKAGGIPIIVGGTGLYHQQLFTTDPHLHIPPNEEVRQRAATSTLLQLQEWLQKVAPGKFAQMNDSDRQNPRRLVRAIELALSPAPAETHAHASPVTEPPAYDHLFVGLTAPKEFIEAKITQRVDERLNHGMIEEVTRLRANYTDPDWKLPAFSATGYKEVRAYLEGTLEYEQMRELWTRREVQYAKRQLTWWKKAKDITWFDVSETGLESAFSFLVDKLK
jgi:tRNA dimethylallyltransferase